MKLWFLAALCCLLAPAAHAELYLLVGPSLLLDRQNTITGTAVGLNVTLWGLVPNARRSTWSGQWTASPCFQKPEEPIPAQPDGSGSSTRLWQKESRLHAGLEMNLSISPI